MWDVKATSHLHGRQGQCVEQYRRIMKGTLTFLLVKQDCVLHAYGQDVPLRNDIF